MQCSDFEHQLDDWLDGDLDADSAQALERHAESCAACQQRLERSRNMLLALRQLPAPDMPADLAERLLGGERRQRRQWGVRSLAIAASLLVAVTAGLLVNQRDAEMTAQEMAPQQWVSMAVAQPRNVQLALTAPTDLEGAVLTLELPEGVEFQGHPERRQLRWTTSLRKGENRLVLPLIATERNDTELVLRIEHGDKHRTMRIGVHANGRTYSTERVNLSRGNDTV